MKSFFISSTFKDMQAERDLLHKTVFPQLRKTMQKYGEDIQELDLRWGVDTSHMSEEESGYQVLKVCIDAIDRCHPYIIVLLGERYGWIPDENIVHSLHDTRMEDLYAENMSITNLEIRYGTLSEEETLRNCVFCFRDPSLLDRIDEAHRPLYSSESEMHRKKLQLLKEEIRSKKNAVILDYSADWDNEKHEVCGLDDFLRQITYLLKQMILRDFADHEVKHPVEQLQLQMKLRQEQYLTSYIPRYREEYLIIPQLRLNLYQNGMTDPIRYQILVKGEAGSGKSALMASLAHIMEREDCHVIMYFSGESGCQNPDTLNRYVIHCLEKIGGYSHEPDTSVTERLRFLYNRLKDKPVFIFIDALDQLIPSGNANLELLSICPNFCYILSSTPDFPLENTAKPLGLSKLKTVVLEELALSDRQAIVSEISEKRGKTLDAVVTDMTVHENQAGNPLYLSMLLQRFFMMTQKEFETAENLAPGMEGIHRYMKYLLEEMPDDTVPMVRYLLEVTGQKFHLTGFSEILALLALSEYGLTESELEEIMAFGGMQFRQLEFQQVVSYLYDAFSQREDGKWCFSHRLFSQAVCEELSEDDTAYIVNLLAEYSLKNKDFVEKEGFRYVLESRHAMGSQVLLDSRKWKTKQQVRDLVMKMISQSEENREYFLDLTRSYAGDEICKFWSSCQNIRYDEVSSRFLSSIWELLLNNPVSSPENRYHCGIRLSEYLSNLYFRSETTKEKENVLERISLCFDEMKKLCYKIEDPKRRCYLSGLHNRQAVFLAKQNSFDSLQLAWKEYAEASDILSPLLESLSQWDEDDIDSILRQDAQNKVDYAIDSRVHGKNVLTNLLEDGVKLVKSRIDEHRSSALRDSLLALYTELLISCQSAGDYPKSIVYGDLALKLSEELLTEEAAPAHRQARMKVLLNYAYSLNGAYRYPYHEEYLMLSRQACADYPDSLEYREKLAYALCLFAYSADQAIKKPSSDMTTGLLADLLHKSEECWKEGLELYDDVLETIPEESDKIRITHSIVYYCAAKSITELKRGCCKKALSSALRGLELADRYWTVRGKESETGSADLRDLNYAAAQAYLKTCQLDKALPYSENSVKYAEIRHIQTGRTFPSEAKALSCCSQILYELRRDEDALLCAEKAVSCYLSLSGSYEQELAQLHYVESRIFLTKKDYSKAMEHRDAFASFACLNSGDAFYGKLLLLDADIMGLKEKVNEQKAKLYEALHFWESFSRLSCNRQNDSFHVDMNPDGTKFTTYLCRTDSGDFLKSCFYHHYTLQQLVLLGETDAADSFYNESIWNYTDNRYLFFLWLPHYYPAFSRLNEGFPKDYASAKRKEAYFRNNAVLIKEQVKEIIASAAEPDAAWDNIVQDTRKLYRMAYTGYCDYSAAVSTQDQKLRLMFRAEEEKDISELQPEWEKLQFSTRKLRREMFFKPIMELYDFLLNHRNSLSQKDELSIIIADIDNDAVSAEEIMDLIPDQLLSVLIEKYQVENIRKEHSSHILMHLVAEYYRRTRDSEEVIRLLDTYEKEGSADSMVQLIRLVLVQADEAMIKLLLQYLRENARIVSASDYFTLHLLYRECKEAIAENCPDCALLSEQLKDWWNTINQLYWEKAVLQGV